MKSSKSTERAAEPDPAESAGQVSFVFASDWGTDNIGGQSHMPDMLVKLYELPDASPLINALNGHGIMIRAAMPYEKHPVSEWVRNTFDGAWDSECDFSFSNHPVSCFIATEAGKIIGFACYDSTCKNFFGPSGVAETKRGLGIGKALLLSCLNAMRANGFAYAIVGGVGPAEFYSRAVGAITIEGSSPGIYRDRLYEDNRANNPDAGDG